MKPSWKLCAALSAALALLLAADSALAPESELAALLPLVCASALHQTTSQSCALRSGVQQGNSVHVLARLHGKQPTTSPAN